VPQISAVKSKQVLACSRVIKTIKKKTFSRSQQGAGFLDDFPVGCERQWSKISFSAPSKPF
jgi:hypothetical protein